MRDRKIKEMMIASMLCAIGIIIPMFSPLKIIIEPASFTLASHVAIMVAMFLSPRITITVVLGTTLGFFLGGFPITVVMRAASHLVFAGVGSYILMKNSSILFDKKRYIVFIITLSLLHAITEVVVVLPFFLQGSGSNDFFYTLFILVGIGTFIHSLIDFVLAKMIYLLPSIQKLNS